MSATTPSAPERGVTRQWPDNICSGRIRYERGGNYEGFILSDAEHGIPTFGSVATTDPVTIRGQYVHVFNYPKQTEDIARRLVACWNACVGISIEELERRGTP